MTFALVAMAALRAKSAVAANGPKTSRPKNKASGGGTGPSLTKSGEKLGEYVISD